MKRHLLHLFIVFIPFAALAHDHIEVGLDPGNPSRLAMVGTTSQTATYFPLGEAPSNFLSQFPGGYFASELTFSAEGDVLDVPSPSYLHV